MTRPMLPITGMTQRFIGKYKIILDKYKVTLYNLDNPGGDEMITGKSHLKAESEPYHREATSWQAGRGRTPDFGKGYGMITPSNYSQACERLAELHREADIHRALSAGRPGIRRYLAQQLRRLASRLESQNQAFEPLEQTY